VNYWSGYRNNLKEISNYCSENNIFLIVDAIQGFGAVPIDFDVQMLDAFICSSHKWIKSLEGACFSFISEKLNNCLDQTH
ncbi:aminotransferase class V-fold PLP-dependent enzyme, partial [Burkholderia pseudomallei]